MCFIFNHKINSFQFFNFKNYKSESTLGYVSHKYNEKSLYQKAGNFFIGIGPIISGTLFMILSFKFLLPNKFSLLNMDNYLFYLSNINIEIYLMICVSTHISLSKKDFENSSIGIFSLFIIFFMITFICIMLNLNSILIIFINCLLYLSIFLTIGLIFSIVSLGIVFLLSLIN